MTPEQQCLRTTIRRVRWRFKSIASARGLALWLALSLAVVAIAVVSVDYWNYGREVISLARWTSLLIIGLSFVWLVVRPLARRVSDARIARTIEEHYPQLQDRLVTAIELARPASQDAPAHPFLSLLLRDAACQSRIVQTRKLFNRKEPYQSILVGSMLVLVFVLLRLYGPGFLEFATLKLYADRWWPQAVSLYQIDVSPGDARIRKGSDQAVTAKLRGFEAEHVQLFFRNPQGGSWKSQAMTTEAGSNAFGFSFLDVGEPIRYYVQAGNVRSGSYELSVMETARVQKIDLTYRFPAYTGLPQRIEENGGDIAALQGTRVEVRASTSIEPLSARILLSDGTSIPMRKTPGPTVVGEIKVSKDASYQIQLSDRWNAETVGSYQYSITALQDQPPQLALTKPGRDKRATPLEEVLTETRADDDFGLRSLELHYTLNGGQPSKVKLFKLRGGRSPRSISGTYTFFLEEFELQPGDFVSYFAKASDARATTTSDIYFLEVRPFGKKYLQRQSGSGQAGGSGSLESLLSRRQKEILVATWRLIRDREQFEKQEYRNSLQLVADLQIKLQQRTQSLANRIQRRALTSLNEGFQKFYENLIQAVQAMGPAHFSLSQRKPEEAVPHQQTALRFLMRAETFYKEIQVARGRAQGQSTWAQELESLFELELDKLKNQYEVQQQRRASKSREQLDEATRKLRELARRQQQINQSRRRQMLNGIRSPGEPAEGSGQAMLRAEAEKLARQLERLSRETERPSLKDVSQRLRRAAREMQNLRRAQGSAAENRGLQALSRLQDARSVLDRERQADIESDLKHLQNQAQSLLQRQTGIQSELERLQAGIAQEEGIAPLLKRKRRILKDKTGMQQSLKEMENQLFTAAKRADSQQRETSRKLRAASQSIQNQGLHEQISQSRQFIQLGLLDLAGQAEKRIKSALSDLKNRVSAASESIGKGPGKPSAQERLSRALTQAGNLLSSLESLKRRIAELQAQSGRDRPTERPKTGSGRFPAPNQPDGTRQGSQAGNSRSGETNEQSRRSRGRGQTAVNFGDQELAPPLTPTPRQFRQFEKEYQYRLGEARNLSKGLRGYTDLATQVRNMVKRMEQMKSLRFLHDPQELERLRQGVIEGVRQLEFDLSRQVRQLTEGDPIHLVRDEEAPSRYRKQVDDYYKALSQ